MTLREIDSIPFDNKASLEYVTLEYISIDLLEEGHLLISGEPIFINWTNTSHHKKERRKKEIIQPSFKSVGRTNVKWQTFEKLKNKRQIYDSLKSTDKKTDTFTLHHLFKHKSELWEKSIEVTIRKNYFT